MSVNTFVISVKQLLVSLAIILLVGVTTTRLQAQQWPFELWHEGKIVLLEGDTLKGMVKYDLQQDLLQYNYRDQKVEAYSPRKVLFFEIYDNSVHRYRQFFALPYNATTGYKTPVFFELLEEGKLTLLSREALENRTYSSPYYVGSYSRIVLVNKYFFMSEDGDIEAFTGDKNDLLGIMGKRADEVHKYIRTNRLDLDDKYDFAKIIAFYNSLF